MVNAMKSLVIHTQVDRIYFIIEDDQFPYKLPKNITTINVKDQKWVRSNCPNINPWWGGVMNLMRIVLTKILPNEDKVLYLDIDTIVNDDISELWDIDISNYYAAGVRDTPDLNKNGLYVNAGVMLFNLKKMREDHIDDKWLEIAHGPKRRFALQDPMNEALRGKIYELPTQYNSCKHFMNFDPDWRKIMHFAGDRQYVNLRIAQYYKKLELSEDYYESSSI